MAKPSQPGSSATEEEPSFPRGGASSITPLKRRQIRADAQADAERDFSAGISAGDPASNKRRKKSGKAAGQVQVLVTAASTIEPVSSCVRSNSIPKAHCYFDSTLDTSSATQGIETSFLARELAHGKAPAFVELLKFKVGLKFRVGLVHTLCSKCASQEQQLDSCHADLQCACQGVGRSV